MIAWKVVRVENERFYSVMMARPTALRYEVGRVTKPKAGLILVFRSHAAARAFTADSKTRILKCRVGPRGPLPLRRLRRMFGLGGIGEYVFSLPSIRAVFKNKCPLNWSTEDSWPAGSMGVEWVKPLKVVK